MMSNLFRYARSSVVSGLLMFMSFGALAYDFKRVEVAIESLSPATQGQWERKATAGESIAQNVTGMAYKYGIGVAQDQAVSLKWFRSAAEQGEADAQFNLARIYESNANDGFYRRRARPVPTDDSEALKWYRRSAEQNHTQAQVKLAQLYAKGAAPVAPDPVQAYKWLGIAAARGDATAVKLRADLAVGMTHEQIAEGDAQTMEWTSRSSVKQ